MFCMTNLNMLQAAGCYILGGCGIARELAGCTKLANQADQLLSSVLAYLYTSRMLLS